MMVDVKVAGGGSVAATDGHPFWNATTREWARANHLKAGQELLTSSGATLGLTSTVVYSDVLTAYNLTVTDLHTYYVVAESTPVLVHNCPPADGVPYGLGGEKAPHSPSKRNLDGGVFKDKEAAVARAREKEAANDTARYRDQCAPDKCHVHVDVYNGKGEVLETWHYQWHGGK